MIIFGILLYIFVGVLGYIIMVKVNTKYEWECEKENIGIGCGIWPVPLGLGIIVGSIVVIVLAMKWLIEKAINIVLQIFTEEIK